ncbi:MAG: transglutaminase family protein [Pseudomonadota bacterium]
MGISTPHHSVASVDINTDYKTYHIPGSNQWVGVTGVPGHPVRLTYTYANTHCPYPEEMFAPRPSRFTRVADGVAEDVKPFQDTDDSAQSVVDHVTSLFRYGHVDTTYYDDADELPQLCDMVTGSCVDINAYLIASLRAAGVEAGYITGYFFPEEKAGSTYEMHCWVVSRDEVHGCREWDIAHFLKMGRRDVHAGLNPKPGRRAAIAHSMGHNIPALGIEDAKLIAEPMWITLDGPERAEMDIRLSPW